MGDNFNTRADYSYLQNLDQYNLPHNSRDESTLQTNVDVLDDRHSSQVSSSSQIESNDQMWMNDKNDAVRLTNLIDQKKINYDTYSKAIETSNMLYNRERHRTLVMIIVVILALIGCGVVWLV
tara:strand:+ start:9729 stop:10097 length:369 start_codon:yes stop_codon:yes gene_type:complete